MLIPATIMIILGNGNLPTEVSTLRLIPLILAPFGVFFSDYLASVCSVCVAFWTADFMQRLLNNVLYVRVAVENIAVISVFVIIMDYST